VVYVGGCAKDGKTPKDTRTPEQKMALAKILEELHNQFPDARLYGHRELVCSLKRKDPHYPCSKCKHYPELCIHAKKSCPSFDVHEYDYIFNNK
jgi:N-acetylmuramoyl-L-alanine amidase